jgi:hypothetical protein
MKKKKDNLRDIWDKIKGNNACIVRIADGGKRKRQKPH